VGGFYSLKMTCKLARPSSSQTLRRPVCIGLWWLLFSFSAQGSTLLLLNWEDYLAPEVVVAFKKEFGHDIQSVIYDSDEQRDEILLSSAGKGFDLVVIDSLSLQLLGPGLLVAVNENNVSSLKQTAPRWREGCGGYGAPYFWGTLGIVYRSDILQTKPDSWGDLLMPSDALKGHVGMLLDYSDTLTPALRMLGASVNTGDINELKGAYDLLLKQKPFVLTNRYAISFQQEAKDKDQLHMALAYSGDEYGLNGDGNQGPWQYVVPKEGTSMWIDCLSVTASSPHKAAALEFINFVNRAEVAALNANQLGTTTVNVGAEKIINDKTPTAIDLYPSSKDFSISEQYQPISDANLRQRNRIIRAISR